MTGMGRESDIRFEQFLGVFARDASLANARPPESVAPI